MAAPHQSQHIIDGKSSIGDWTPSQLEAFITNLLHVEPWTIPSALNMKQMTVSDQLTLGDESEVAFFGANPSMQPTVSGSKGANAALASLITALVQLGLINDTTT